MMKKNTKKGVKVVYISSPMKVKTSASEFRALVQELTGLRYDCYFSSFCGNQWKLHVVAKQSQREDGIILRRRKKGAKIVIWFDRGLEL
uniref:VQ domain-containing protein n=1 Tax=Cannabis sativa TaxID=3483 RepID=A0A803NSS0_CANSA